MALRIQRKRGRRQHSCGSGFNDTDTDSDPSFQVNPDPIWIRGFDDQKLIFYLIDQKLQFTYRKASIKGVQVTGEAFSLKREHPALQKMKFINFFLCLLVIFALLDPDPDYESASGYGSRDPIESGSNPNPVPQHWKAECLRCKGDRRINKSIYCTVPCRCITKFVIYFNIANHKKKNFRIRFQPFKKTFRIRILY
jgi:hypothetical protein